MKIVALAGGVGGAKLADGLARNLATSGSLSSSQGQDSLTVIVNTGDDFTLWGLRICPDLDTVMYTLAGIANPETGWGIQGDTFEALGMLKRLGDEVWFRVGDRDLATHLRRTLLMQSGKRLTDVTESLCRSLGIPPNIRVLPMTDAPVATLVDTDEGTLAFQDYFVRRGWQPAVRRIRFDLIQRARLSQETRSALAGADLIVICPSNPLVSVDPILGIEDVRDQLRTARTVAVSPLVGGEAIKGPAAKMFRELGKEPTALAVARHYADFLDAFVIDQADADQQAGIEQLRMRVLVTDTLMRDAADRARLAREVLDWARAIPA